MLKPLTIAVALVAAPSAAFAQFGGFVPQSYSTQAMINAVAEAAQTIKGATPSVNEAMAVPVTRIAVAEARDRMALALANGGVSLWSLDQGREIRRMDTGTVTLLALSADGATLAVATGDGGIQVWDAAKGRRKSSITAAGVVSGLAIGEDGAQVLITTAAGSRLVDSEDGRDIARWTGPAALHPSEAVVITADEAGLSLTAPGTAKPRWQIAGPAAQLAFSLDGTRIVAGAADGTLRVIDATSGQVTASAAGGGAPALISVGFSSALVGDGAFVKRLDLSTGTLGEAIPLGARDVRALRDGAVILSAQPDSTLRLTDPAHPAVPLARLVLGRDGWAVVAEGGEFDAENDGMDAVKWVAGQEAFSLDQFADSHFQPGLLTRLLTRGEPVWRDKVAAAAKRLAEQRAEIAQKAAADKATRQKAEQDRLAQDAKRAEDARRLAEEQARVAAQEAAKVAEDARRAEDAKKVVISKEFAMPPKVAFESPGAEASSDSEDFKLTYTATDLGGGVQEVRLYQNGKLVASQDANAAADGFKAKLAQGANEFRLVALSRDRIESRPAKVKVTYTGAERKSTLHVVAVGINTYRNPALNLNYGVGDAKGIAEYFAAQPRTIYQDVVLHTLYDDKATKANIIALLASLKDTKPEDSVIIYLAGHGDTLNDGWYFMPTDVRYPEREDEVRERGLPSSEINARIKDMGAQKILMLVDACKSGAALVAFRGFEDRKALMQVARSSGVHVVAAAGKEQFAAELPQLGHGLFTYTLLDGLKGKADRKQARVITVRGLTAYVEDQLPELSQSFKGVAQFPVVDSRGMDFPVATY